MHVKLSKGLGRIYRHNKCERFQAIPWPSKNSVITLNGSTKSLQTNKKTNSQLGASAHWQALWDMIFFPNLPIWNSGLFALLVDHSQRVTIKESVLDYAKNPCWSGFTSLHLHIAKLIWLYELRHQHRNLTPQEVKRRLCHPRTDHGHRTPDCGPKELSCNQSHTHCGLQGCLWDTRITKSLGLWPVVGGAVTW